MKDEGISPSSTEMKELLREKPGKRAMCSKEQSDLPPFILLFPPLGSLKEPGGGK